MISVEKLKILTPLQKLPNNVGDLGKLIVAKGFEKSIKKPNLVTQPTSQSSPSSCTWESFANFHHSLMQLYLICRTGPSKTGQTRI